MTVAEKRPAVTLLPHQRTLHSRPVFCEGGFFCANAPARHWIQENKAPWLWPEGHRGPPQPRSSGRTVPLTAPGAFSPPPPMPGKKVVVTIEMSGSRRQDFYQAMEALGIARDFPPKTERPPGYTWHHVDDFAPETGTCTMQLVFGKAHAASNHKGSVYQWGKYFGKDYRRLK